MPKKHILFFSLAVLFLAGAAAISAQEEKTIAPEETITVNDLEVSEPRILPASPLYFFKELGRGLQNMFTFNPVAKAELQLKFANEKASEVKKVMETQPQNDKAIQGAFENYQNAKDNLGQRIENLSETSQNPRVNALLDNMTDKMVKHEKLFDEIAFKFKGNERVSEAVRDTKSQNETIMGEVSKKDDPAKFASRLEEVLLAEKGGELKHARSIEIIDNFGTKTSVETKKALEGLREDFSEKLEQDIKILVETKGEDSVKKQIVETPGDFSARSVIIAEIQKRAEERVSQAIEKAMNQLENVLQKERDVAQKAREQIERSDKIVQEAERAVSQREEAKTSKVVPILLGEARDNLSNARKAFDQQQYGEAFGQARSAEVLARNALRFLEHELAREETKEEPRREPKIEKSEQVPVKIQPFPSNPITRRCEDIHRRITELKKLFEAKEIDEATFKSKYDSRLRDLITCQEERNIMTPLPPTSVAPPTNVPPVPVLQRPSQPEVICTQEYKPVCGSDGKTYTNFCFAKSAGAPALYEGECKTETPVSSGAALKLISPNGGEQWQMGNTYTIKWENPGNIPGIYVDLYKGDTYLSGLGGLGTKFGGGPTSWTWETINTPNFEPGSDFKIRIKSDTNKSIYDESDNYFSVTGPAPSPGACDDIKAVSATNRFFEQCKNGGYDQICFNKYYYTYQGCNRSIEYDGCTSSNNMNADKNILCDTGLVYTCSDTDREIYVGGRGKNYSSQGTVTDNGKTYTDYCQDGSVLKEYFCSFSDDNPTGVVAEENYGCASGCENGACSKTEKLLPVPEQTSGSNFLENFLVSFLQAFGR